MRWPSLERLERILDRFSQRTLLVLGDLVLDEYLWGEAERVSPEAPVPVVHIVRESRVLGGAGNVVRNLAALGAQPRFCSVVGEDPAGRRVLELLAELDVPLAGVIIEAERPTTRKTRVLARSQQVVRFDRETTNPIARRTARDLLAALQVASAGCEGVILEDYGKGVLSANFLRQAMRHFITAGLPVSVDPKNDLRLYRGASLVKPNLREAEALSGVLIRGPGDLDRAARRLRRVLPGTSLVVTRGGEGMALYESEERVDVATPEHEVFDVQGAGDTAIAALTLALRTGASLPEAALIANAAAGVVVGKIGTATANSEEVRRQLPAALEAAGKAQ